MLALTLALAAIPVPQGTAQGSMADAPVGLTIVMVDVGQGEGFVVRAPDGQVHVMDAGPDGKGTASMLPVINSLQPTGYGYTVLSHFHQDHVGGLDELLLARPFQVALDRGDVNRGTTPTNTAYLAAAGARRQLVTVGATYQLGGGATMTCICANANVMGGVSVNPALAEEENARSIAIRINYGDFSMWIGGDLTGGGQGTADVESPAAASCGDVDVYTLNHHGSNTSTNANLVAALQPELSLVSCGTGNGYGQPSIAVTYRINKALAARALLSTTKGSSTAIGFGVTGNLRLDTDGYRYRATAQSGDFLDFYCDEVVPESIAAGDIRISELHRDPSAIADTNGEYVEVVNVGAKPIALAGLSLSENGGSVVLASNYMLVPGRTMVFQVDGVSDRNGGLPLGVPLPANSLAWNNTSDSVVVQQAGTTIDSLAYVAGFPGGSGVAAERRDLLAPHNPGQWNYAAATTMRASGEFGTPGATNAADSTRHPVQVGVTVRSDRFTLHATALDHGSSFLSVLGLSFSASNGFAFGGAQIPLDADPLLAFSLGVAGFLSVMPGDGYRSIDLLMPPSSPASGLQLFVAHIVLDPTLLVAGVSPAVSFVVP